MGGEIEILLGSLKNQAGHKSEGRKFVRKYLSLDQSDLFHTHHHDLLL